MPTSLPSTTDRPSTVPSSSSVRPSSSTTILRSSSSPQRSLYRGTSLPSSLSTGTNAPTVNAKVDTGKGITKPVPATRGPSLPSRTTLALRQRLTKTSSPSTVLSSSPMVSSNVPTVNKPPVPKYIPKDNDSSTSPTSSNNPLLLCQRLNIYARLRPFLSHEKLETSTSGPLVHGHGDLSRITLNKDEHTVCIWPAIEENNPLSSVRTKSSSSSSSSASNDSTVTGTVEPKKFVFDNVYSMDQKQAEVHRETTAPAIDEVLKGTNSVILVYGQTGSGKTYTVFGPDTDATRIGATDASQLGLIPRAIHDLFERITLRNEQYRQQKRNEQQSTSSANRSRNNSIDSAQSYRSLSAFSANYKDDSGNDTNRDPPEYPPPDLFPNHTETKNTNDKYIQIAIRYCQLYQDTWIDLLANEVSTPIPSSSSSLTTVASPTVATILPCTNVRTVLHLLHKGSKKKIVAATSMNSNSSRGHTVFQIFITKPSEESSTVSTLTFIDLAGSERIGRSNAQGITLNEARFINKSLHALGVCLTALATSALRTAVWNDRQRYEYNNSSLLPPQTSTFIPWRSSKLTRFLQSCIAESDPQRTGYCLPSSLSLIVCLSPTEASISETLSTLTFASRARAYAEALAGNVTQARTLLNEDAHRTPVLSSSSSIAMHTNDAPLSTTTDSPVSLETVSSTLVPLPPGPSVPTGNTTTNNISEIEAVLDRQRTQIGSLTQQYEALLASHMQLQERLLQAESVANNARNVANTAVNETQNMKLLEYSNSRLAATAITASKALGDDTIALQLEATIAAAIESGNEEVLRAAVEEAARVSAQYTHQHLHSPLGKNLPVQQPAHRITLSPKDDHDDDDADSRAGDFDDQGLSLLQQISLLNNEEWENDSLHSMPDPIALPLANQRIIENETINNKNYEHTNSVPSAPLSLEELSRVPLSPLAASKIIINDTAVIDDSTKERMFTSPDSITVNDAIEVAAVPFLTAKVSQQYSDDTRMLMTPGFELPSELPPPSVGANGREDYNGSSSFVKNLHSVAETIEIEPRTSTAIPSDTVKAEVYYAVEHKENTPTFLGTETVSVPSRRGSTPNTIDLLDILELEKELLSNSKRVQDYEESRIKTEGKDTRSVRTIGSIGSRSVPHDNGSLISEYHTGSLPSMNKDQDGASIRTEDEEHEAMDNNDHDALDLSIIKAGNGPREPSIVPLSVPVLPFPLTDDNASVTEHTTVSPSLSSFGSNHSSPAEDMDENRFRTYPYSQPVSKPTKHSSEKKATNKNCSLQYYAPQRYVPLPDVLDIPLSPDILTPMHHRHLHRSKQQQQQYYHQRSTTAVGSLSSESQSLPYPPYVTSPPSSDPHHYSYLPSNPVYLPNYRIHDTISPIVVSTPNALLPPTPASLLQEISPITNRTFDSSTNLSSIVSPTTTVNTTVRSTMMSPEKNQALLVVQAALERAQGVLSRLNDLRSKRTTTTTTSTVSNVVKNENGNASKGKDVPSTTSSKSRRGRPIGTTTTIRKTPASAKHKPKILPPTIPEEEGITLNTSTDKGNETSNGTAGTSIVSDTVVVNTTKETESSSTKSEIFSKDAGTNGAAPVHAPPPANLPLPPSTTSESIPSSSTLNNSTMSITELQPAILSTVMNTLPLANPSVVTHPSGSMEDVLKIAATVAEVVATRIVQAMTTNLSTSASVITPLLPPVTLNHTEATTSIVSSTRTEESVPITESRFVEPTPSSAIDRSENSLSAPILMKTELPSRSTSPILNVQATPSPPILIPTATFHCSTQSSPFLPVTNPSSVVPVPRISSTIPPVTFTIPSSKVSRSSSPITVSSTTIVPSSSLLTHSRIDASTTPIVQTMDQSTETDNPPPTDTRISSGTNNDNHHHRRASVSSILSNNASDSSSRNPSPSITIPISLSTNLPPSQPYASHTPVAVEDHPVILIIDDSDSDDDDDDDDDERKEDTKGAYRGITSTNSAKPIESIPVSEAVVIHQPHPLNVNGTTTMNPFRRSSLSSTTSSYSSIRELESQLAHEAAAVANAVDNERRRNSVSSIRSVLTTSISQPASRRPSVTNISPNEDKQNTNLPTIVTTNRTMEMDELTLALMNTKAILAKALVSLEEDEDIKIALQTEPSLLVPTKETETIPTTEGAVVKPIVHNLATNSLHSPMLNSKDISKSEPSSPKMEPFGSTLVHCNTTPTKTMMMIPAPPPFVTDDSPSFLHSSPADSSTTNTNALSSTTVTPSSSPPPPPIQPPRPQLPLAQTKPETARGIHSVNSFQYRIMSGKRSSMFDSSILREHGPSSTETSKSIVPVSTVTKFVTSPPPVRRSSKPEIIFSHTVSTVSIEPKPVPYETALMDIPAPLPSLNIRAPSPPPPPPVESVNSFTGNGSNVAAIIDSKTEPLKLANTEILSTDSTDNPLSMSVTTVAPAIDTPSLTTASSASIPIYLPGQGVVMVSSSMLDAMGVVVDMSGTLINLPAPLPPPPTVPSTPVSKSGKGSASTKKKKKKVAVTNDNDTNPNDALSLPSSASASTPAKVATTLTNHTNDNSAQALPPPPSTKPPPLPPLSKLSMRKK